MWRRRSKNDRIDAPRPRRLYPSSRGGRHIRIRRGRHRRRFTAPARARTPSGETPRRTSSRSGIAGPWRRQAVGYRRYYSKRSRTTRGTTEGQMMSIVLRSPKAEQDLDDIWDYISQDNPTAAANLLRQLDSKFQMLSRNPQMGQDRSDLAPFLRCFSSG